MFAPREVSRRHSALRIPNACFNHGKKTLEAVYRKVIVVQGTGGGLPEKTCADRSRDGANGLVLIGECTSKVLKSACVADDAIRTDGHGSRVGVDALEDKLETPGETSTLIN